MRPDLILEGVIPANLMAFDSEWEIDEENYRRHLRHLVDTPGVTGITTNAHASEVTTLTFQEQQRVLDVTLDEVAGAVPVVCGVYEDGQGGRDREVGRAAGGRWSSRFPDHSLRLRASTQARDGLRTHRPGRRGREPATYRVRLPGGIGAAHPNRQSG